MVLEQLQLKENCRPVFFKARKVPYASFPKIDKDLELWVKEDATRKVENSDWDTLIVPVVKSKCPNDKDHLDTLDHVLSRSSEYNIGVNLGKCDFLQDDIEYYGYIIDKNGLHKCKGKIEAVQNAPCLTNGTETRAFIGLVNY